MFTIFKNLDRFCYSIIGSLFILLILVNIARPSVLSDTANSLQPGEWAIIPTNGWNYEFYMDTTLAGVYPTHAWMNTAKYDSNTNQVYVLGNAHGEGGTTYLFTYNVDSNSWSKEATLPNIGAHGFDQMAIEANGTLWGRVGGSSAQRLMFHPQALGAWQETPQSGSSALYWSDALGMEYHPLWGAPLIFGQNTIQIFKDGVWRNVLRNAIQGIRNYHLIAEYNFADSAMYLGGGNNNGGPYSTQLWRVFPDSSWEAIAPAPENIGIEQGIFSFDPATGEGLLVTRTGNFYGYDYVLDEWYYIGNTPLQLVQNHYVYGVVAIPIAEYGVTMYAALDDIYLYKHGDPAPPDTNPEPPVPPDTTCMADTLFSTDTLEVTVTDTLFQVDSVFVPQPVFTWPDSIWMNDSTLYLKQ